MQINTLFQLYSMVLSNDPQLGIAATLLSISDLFLYFLSGSKSAEFTGATTTQMYSGTARDWARNVLEKMYIPLSILPPVLQPGTVVSLVRNCGFDKNVPAIAVATHDTASAVAAIPHLDSHSAFISSGTWSLMGVEVEKPDTSQDAMRLGFTNEGSASGAFLLLKNITGLWVLQECIRQWSLEGQNHVWSAVIEAAVKAEPFRAICDPNDRRLQAQSNMPAAICAYCHSTGQQQPETLGEFARFVFDSLSLKYRSVLHSLELLTGKDLQTLRVVGGGSLNTFLCQLMADVCNRVVVSGPSEASALGNILLQAVATGHLPSLEAGRSAIADSGFCRTFEPTPVAGWDEAYARFQSLEVD